MTTYFNSGFFQRPAGCLFQVPSTSGVNLLCLRTGVVLNVSSDSLGVLLVATEAQIQQEALSSYLALEKKHEAEMTELKSRYIAALGGELKDLSSELDFEPCETEPRPRMSEDRMRELLAEGRLVRKAVEKDIAEMRHVSRGE